MKSIRAAFFFFFALLSAWVCVAQQTPPTPVTQSPVAVVNNLQLVIEGKVINVHDGDTVTVLDQSNRKFHIRLQGIDAPELKQEFGSVSQQNLSRLVLGKQVSIFWNKVDKYRRTVGTIKLDGQDMNIEQVKAGLAWHFKKYEDEQEPQDRITYAAAEQQARAARLGLWQDEHPTPPGDWRQGVKAKRWGPPPPEGTIVGNRNSKKYQRPDCSGYRDTSEKNRVFFKTVEEAEAAGFKRAGNCPAEIQVAQTKPGASIQAVSQPVSVVATSPTAVSNTRPEVPLMMVKAGPELTGQQSAQNGKPDQRIIGNKNSKKYQRPDCSGYLKTSEENRVYFNTVAEAEAAGFTRAGNCPEEVRVVKTETPAASKPAAEPPTVAATSPALTPTSEQSAQNAKPDQRIIGNKNSKKYQRPDCSGYLSSVEKNRVYFNTVAEAEAAGFTRAGNCPAEIRVTENKTPATPEATTQPASSTATSATPAALPAQTPAAAPAEATVPSEPEANAASNTTSATTSNGDAKIIGNKNSKVYHLPGCASYGRVSEKNQVKFDTAEEAEKAGYKLAGNCSPTGKRKE